MVEISDLAVIIPAYDEEARIAATVEAAAKVPGVDLVLVVDDGSADATARTARESGAIVVRHARNRGKAAAMETGAAALAAIEAREGRAEPRLLLFLDGDLEATAGNAAALAEPVRSGAAGMTIATLPPQPGGGHGFVVRLARDGIRAAVGFDARQPLSGQRCLSRAAFEAALPLARGFGVETGLTIDVLRAGHRIVEVEVDFRHRVTGTDLAAQLHRARQYRDVALALAVRRIPAELRPASWRGRRSA
ncbi:glycosyltransferase [Actinocrinis puniceicyclus]|uniref:Glucosyl-3-phosphoglycerate synthase n=1 Tax=Actinocrinis puniceicyclus TaxID=977794 RepID=A0A8J7WQ81_9ACTN|nr:glycosyltransferase [Actinocrinis puniceicyclus]